MDLDTGELRALVAIADAGGFGRAAARLGITQQGVSRRIARLEHRLGRALVDRTDRRTVRLTAEGSRVVAAARTVISVLDGPTFAPPPAAAIVVDQMADSLVATAWARRAAREGGLSVETVERAPDQSADALVLENRADLAFGRIGAVDRDRRASSGRASTDRSLRSRLVLLEPVALLVPAAHDWGGRSSVSWNELEGRELWFPVRSAPEEWRVWIEAFSAASGASFRTDGAGFGFDAWGRDVTDGRVPPSLIGEGMRSPVADAHVVPIVGPVPVFAWAVFWRDGSTAIHRFLAAAGLTRTPTVSADVWMPEPDRAALDRVSE